MRKPMLPYMKEKPPADCTASHLHVQESHLFARLSFL